MELARRPPHPRSALTTVELSVAIRRPLTIAVPGRTLENAYTRLGNVAERQANKLAHAFGRGPLAAHEHIERFMGVYSACEAKLEEINKKPPEELQRYCSRLLEYAFPTKSAVTQMDCFKCLVSLITRYAGFRAIFLGCPRLERLNPTSDELVQMWGRSDAFGTLEDFTFDLGFAAECLLERTVSAIVESSLAQGPLWKLDVDQLGLNVIEKLIVSSGCEGTSKYSASLSIRYLGGVVACLSFWLQDGPVFDTTVAKLLAAADDFLKDLGIDSDAAIMQETSPLDSDVEGIDLLCEAIVAGVMWRASHRAPNRIVSSQHDWMNAFTKFVTLLRHPCAESTLPFAWERATSEEWTRLRPRAVSYSLKEFKIVRQESLESLVDPVPTPVTEELAILTPKLTAMTATRNGAPLHHFQFSPDGKKLASITSSWGWPSTVRLVHWPSFSLKASIALDPGPTKAVWSDTGDLLLTKLLHDVVIWDTRTTIDRKIARQTNVESITWFPGGQAFLSVEDNTVTKLDLDGNALDQYDLGPMTLRDVAVTPDGVRLLAIGALLESRTGLRLNESPADNMPFSQRQQLIAVYNTETKQIEHQTPVLDEVRAITLSKNTEQGVVALVSYENKAPPHLWKMNLVKNHKNSNLVANLTLRNTYMPDHVVELAGSSCFGGMHDELVLCADKAGDIHVWDQESGTLLRYINTQAGQTGDLMCIARNHQADDLLMFPIGSRDRALGIWTPPASEHPPESQPDADDEPLPPQSALGVDTDHSPELKALGRLRDDTESAREASLSQRARRYFLSAFGQS